MLTSTVIISQKRKGGQDLLEETGVKKYRYKYRFVVKKQLWSLKTLTNTPLFHLLLLLVFFVLIIMKRSLCPAPHPPQHLPCNGQQPQKDWLHPEAACGTTTVAGPRI